MTTCGYDGTATAAIVGFEPVWTRTDPRIHISAELLANDEAKSHIEQKYLIGNWCDDLNAYHADLKEAT